MVERGEIHLSISLLEAVRPTSDARELSGAASRTRGRLPPVVSV